MKEKKISNRYPKIRISPSIDLDLWEAGKNFNQDWNMLIEFAIKFKIAEFSESYDIYPDCKLKWNLEQAIKKLNEVSQELNDLKSNKELKKIEKTPEEEAEEILNNEFKG
jgi:hypothetical protein